MKYLMLLVSVLALSASACNPGCAIQTAVVNTTSAAIASGLQCSNQAAISADLNTLLSKTGVCSSGQQSVLGDLCSGLATSLVGLAASAGVPAAWGCTAANAQALLNSVALAGCQKAFP